MIETRTHLFLYYLDRVVLEVIDIAILDILLLPYDDFHADYLCLDRDMIVLILQPKEVCKNSHKNSFHE